MKICSMCGDSKPAEAFSKRTAAKDGLQHWCKACVLTYTRERAANDIDAAQARYRAHYQKNREYQQHNRRLRQYGLTKEAYEALLIQQNYACAVCLVPFSECATSPCVDHDHTCCSGSRTCGKCLRGLLCHLCNTALGKFHDDAEVMKRAIAYVERR